MRRSVLATCVASAALVAVTGDVPRAALALSSLGRHVPSAQQSVPHPEPRHSAEDVVGFQLAALRDNDVPTTDAGIAIVFSFSSPANRAVTGVRSPDSPTWSRVRRIVRSCDTSAPRASRCG